MGDGCVAASTEDDEEREDDDDDVGDRWVDGLLRYRFRRGVVLLSDPRGALVRGTGSSLWAAGTVLAAYLGERRPELCRGARCLELGAGTGAVGMTVASAGAKLVVLTDTEQQLPLLKRNQQENFPRGDVVRALPLDWRRPEHRAGLASWAGTWSLIIGSDIGYDPDLFVPLFETLESQWSRDTDVLFALADREEDLEPNAQDFADAAGERGWLCEEVHQARGEPHQSVTKVLRLTREGGSGAAAPQPAPKAARRCAGEER